LIVCGRASIGARFFWSSLGGSGEIAPTSFSLFASPRILEIRAAIPDMEEHEVFSTIGEDGFERLISAFYRQVQTDDLLGNMYPRNDFAGAEKRLRDFLVFRFGGPQRYIEERGHPRLRMRHARFRVDENARDRWLTLMRNALTEAQISQEAVQILWRYFEATAGAMINQA
jgi:hemoglobin